MTNKFMHGSSILLGDNTIPGVQLPKDLRDLAQQILKACKDWGLDFYPTVVQLLTYDEISEIAAYGGFPVRYPHWSFGMEYEELQRGYEYGMHKIFEMVINCCVPETRVLTSYGSIKCNDLQKGDIVYSRNGPRKVIAVERQSVSKVLKIVLDEFANDPICTPNHKWMVLRSEKPEWIKTEDLHAGDFILAGGKYDNFLGISPVIVWNSDAVIENTRSNVRHCLKPINPPNRMNFALAELLGVCIGDGSQGVCGAENTVAVCVGGKLHEYRIHIENLFHIGVGCVAAVYEKNGCYSVQANSKFVVDFLNSVGMDKGITAKDKKIPFIIWQSSNEYRAAFIRGLFDTDGHCKTSLSMSSISFELIQDVQLMLLEMGIRSKVSHVVNDHNNIYVLYIKGRWNQREFAKRIGFSLSYKQQALESLIVSDGASGKSNVLPQKLIEEIVKRLDALPDQKKFPYWIRGFKFRKPRSINAVNSFIFRLVQQGYSGFNDLLELVNTPMYCVTEVIDEKEQETIDIALDHDDHDFLANGLISHNTNPCYQWLLASNTLLDNLTVIAHATGHNDFFKNNIHFSATDTNMLNNMANHGSRIRKYMSRWGKERVIEFMDYLLRIDTLIDGAKAWHHKVIKNPIISDARTYRHARRLKVSNERLYMEPYINTKEFKKSENEKAEKLELADELNLFVEPTKDIFGFLRDNAPLKPWQQDILSMIYEESIYFFPQRQTKVLNEGWACGGPNSLIPTDLGQITFKELVENRLMVNVWDGESYRKVSNWYHFEDRKTITIKTKRGYKWEGSDNHRIYDNDKNWKELRNFKISDLVSLNFSDIWAKNLYEIDFLNFERLTYKKVKDILRQESWKFSYLRSGIYSEEKVGEKISELNSRYDVEKSLNGPTQTLRRNFVKIPSHITEEFASFLGYMIGDGHISIKKRSLGLTTGDLEQANQFQALLKSLFDLNSTIKWDDSSKNGRWRISKTSKNLQDLLIHLGLKTGVCARHKEIPNCIMKSPKAIMSSFIRSYFDCDGYAGKAGVILSTSSEKLGEQIQNVLLNYGIISTRKKVKSSDPSKTHIWHVSIRGKYSIKFRDEIGFGLDRKKQKLNEYIDNHKFFFNEKWDDEIVSIEHSNGVVYDITVENTHRYVAQGFMNHNSLTDHVIMAEQGYSGLGQKSHDCGIIEYAAHKMSVLGGKYSTNPYKLGFNLLRDIRDRWDKGRFGTEWEDCLDVRKKENWDTKAGLGKEKIFEVRKYYDDLTFIHEYFTEEFCREQEYFEWKKYNNGETRIESHDYKTIKGMLMRRHVNGGLPDLKLVEPNYRGKGYFLIQHNTDGRQLFDPYVKDVMTALKFIWGNDIFLATNDEDGTEIIYECRSLDAAKVRRVTRKKHIEDLW